MKLSPGVNFTNILQAQIPKEQENTEGLTVFFALMGSWGAKAAVKCW